jgi:hypothetical protein
MTQLLAGILSDEQVTRIVATILGVAIGVIFRHLIADSAKDKRQVGLTAIEQAVEDALQAAIQVAPNASRKELLNATVTAAKTQLMADAPNVVSGVEASIDVLLAGHAAQKLAIAPGGSTVSLPNLGGAK